MWLVSSNQSCDKFTYKSVVPFPVQLARISVRRAEIDYDYDERIYAGQLLLTL
jgi:hypothetical protein